MIKALLLVFEPGTAWDRIVRGERTVGQILVLYLLPLLCIPAVVEGYALVSWGKWQSEIGHLKHFKVNEAVAYEVFQVVLTVVLLLLSSFVVKSMVETFHSRHTFLQAFTTVVYGLSPLLTLRLLDAIPGISPWVAYGVGALLSVAILYHGVPRVMEPDPSHAFGLYLTTSILLVLVTGLLRYATAAYLQGKLPKLHALLGV